MKRVLNVFLIINSISAWGQTKSPSMSDKLDEYFTALTSIKKFNGNLLVASEQKILLSKTYNIKGFSDSMLVTKKSQFLVGSASKLFIKLAVLKLVSEEKIQLDDPVDKYILAFPNGNKITVAHLVNNKSGLPRTFTDIEKINNLTLPIAIELAKKEKLQFEPNTKVLNSNIGYYLLLQIIEKSTGQPYQSYISKTLKSIKVNNTGEYNPITRSKSLAFGFDTDGNKPISTTGKYISRYELGNYYSTITDMHNFGEQIYSGKIIKKELAIQMFGNDSSFVQISGQPGYRLYYYKNLKKKVVISFLTNYTDIPLDETIEAIQNLIAGRPYEIPQKINRKKIILAENILMRYEGKFALELDANQVFNLKVQNGMLFLIDKGGGRSELNADTETTFFEDPGSKDGYEFILNRETGKYELFILTSGVKLKTKKIE